MSIGYGRGVGRPGLARYDFAEEGPSLLSIWLPAADDPPRWSFDKPALDLWDAIGPSVGVLSARYMFATLHSVGGAEEAKISLRLNKGMQNSLNGKNDGRT